jgi:hypothetical protein
MENEKLKETLANPQYEQSDTVSNLTNLTYALNLINSYPEIQGTLQAKIDTIQNKI